MPQTSSLSPAARDEALRVLAATSTDEELDVLVVGGGITGAGVALDAVTRGLSTGLVEQRDLASGTSSRSSKLVHGGLRYLEMFDFALVKEALEERGLLLTRLAPHLVRPVPFLYPLHHAYERPYVGAGLVLYDAMAVVGARAGRFGSTGVPKHKHLFRKQVARIAPDLKIEGLHGAIRYYDCQVDDARLVMTLARTAAFHGAQVATRTQVVGLPAGGGAGRRCPGARPRDRPGARRSGPGSSSTPPVSGPTTSRTWSAAGAPSTCRPARASTSWCRATGSGPRPASSPRPRSRCSSSSPGAGTGSSARPTPRGTSTRRIPPPARPTSTTCSAT